MVAIRIKIELCTFILWQKAKKKRANKYEEKLKVHGTFEELIDVSVGKLPEKKPEPAKEDKVDGDKDALKKQDKPIK